jgi:hypothetical protein
MSERSAAANAGAADSGFSASVFERTIERGLPMRWIGWRLRLLVFAALVGSIGVFTLMRWLAASPHIDVVLQSTPQGTLVLAATALETLQPHLGQPLVAIRGSDGTRVPASPLLLERSPRWQVDDAERERQVALHERLAGGLAGGGVQFEFADGRSVAVPTPARGYGGIGLLFWPLAALALLLFLIGIVVVLVRPQLRNLLYLAITMAQAGNLLFIAIDSVRGVGMPPGAAAAELLSRLAFDLVSAAAVVHAFALHPRRLPGAAIIGAAAWGITALTLALVHSGLLTHVWWTTQGVILALTAAGVAVVSWSYRLEANPFAAVMRRFSAVALGTLALLTMAVTVVAGQPGVPLQISAIGSVIWYLFLASLLLLVRCWCRSCRTRSRCCASSPCWPASAPWRRRWTCCSLPSSRSASSRR